MPSRLASAVAGPAAYAGRPPLPAHDRPAIARALLKQPKALIFDEATSSLDALAAKHFAATINQLKGKVTMLFITHAMPRGLRADDMVRIGERPQVETAERQRVCR